MKCEFCNKEYLEEELESTSIVGHYCVSCHNLVIAESCEAIKFIQRYKRTHRKITNIGKD